MNNIDVFSGGADGLYALQQLRLVYPCESTLVTGSNSAFFAADTC